MEAKLITKNHDANFNILKVAHNAFKTTNAANKKYFVEDVKILNHKIHVTFIDESLLNDGLPNENDWQETKFTLPSLKNFIVDNDLNTYVYDISDHNGEHVQVSGAIPMDLYLLENINEAVTSYLNDGKGYDHD